jgi:predicted transcriptional regulator of viral defense system
MSAHPSRFAKAIKLFQRHGGAMRMSEALRLGLSRKTLYAMRDSGDLEQLSRGVYRLKGMPELGNPDLVTVAMRAPRGVFCLISALVYHDLTTQVAHEVYLAVERDSEPPRIEYPPVRLFFFSGPAFHEGIEQPKLDGFRVRIYSPEKTVADVFKFRNKLGMDVALEALRLWRERRGRKVELLLGHARHCRVERVIRPYLEALQ